MVSDSLLKEINKTLNEKEKRIQQQKKDINFLMGSIKHFEPKKLVVNPEKLKMKKHLKYSLFFLFLLAIILLFFQPGLYFYYEQETNSFYLHNTTDSVITNINIYYFESATQDSFSVVVEDISPKSKVLLELNPNYNYSSGIFFATSFRHFPAFLITSSQKLFFS